MALRAEDLPEPFQPPLLPGGRRSRKTSDQAKAVEKFAFHLRAHRFDGWIREHRFAQEKTGRQWRFDFCHPALNLAVEVEGLVVRKYGTQLIVSGRHATIGGFQEDCEKYATAAVLGWQVMRFNQALVSNGTAIAYVEQWYATRGIERSKAA